MSSTATAPVSPKEIERLFTQASNNVRANLQGTSEDCRRQALGVARSLVASLENPEDVVMRYVWEVNIHSHQDFTADTATDGIPAYGSTGRD